MPENIVIVGSGVDHDELCDIADEFLLGMNLMFVTYCGTRVHP